ncbi:MAG: ABC transporter ATP-binding protein [Lachnospiraceae bacterium]|nr:ABC transporter ATP-binding protein [Lachnospiraceae bacterium]
MNIIEVQNLTKNYGKSRGINNLNLQIAEGDFFGFIGPNGAGKSTTIRTLLGLVAPSGGQAKIMGYDIVRENRKILEQTGYLPSEINFYSGMKVSDVIKYSANLRKAKCSDKAGMLCDRLGLDTSKKVDELSLGNRKKVGIVCAVQHSPKLLILDEPTSGLDPLMQHEFFNILKEENKAGATVFFSSHVLSEVQNYCRTAAFIKDGKIIMSDKVSNLAETGTRKITLKGNATDVERFLADESDELKGKISNVSKMDGAQGSASVSGESASGESLNSFSQSGVSSNNMNCSFLYNGDISSLLKKLAELKLYDLTITEPSLEEIFMNYYE